MKLDRICWLKLFSAFIISAGMGVEAMAAGIPGESESTECDSIARACSEPVLTEPDFDYFTEVELDEIDAFWADYLYDIQWFIDEYYSYEEIPDTNFEDSEDLYFTSYTSSQPPPPPLRQADQTRIDADAQTIVDTLLADPLFNGHTAPMVCVRNIRLIDLHWIDITIWYNNGDTIGVKTFRVRTTAGYVFFGNTRVMTRAQIEAGRAAAAAKLEEFKKKFQAALLAGGFYV